MKKLLTLILMLLPVVAVLTGCDKDEPGKEPEITQMDYKIYAGETAVAQGVGLSNAKWESRNPYVADVIDGGIIEARKVGWTMIKASGISGFLSVSVYPKITIYSEPILNYHSKWTNGHIEVDYENFHKAGSQYLWGVHINFVENRVKESGVPWKVKSRMKDLLTYETGNSATPLIGYIYDESGYVYASCIYMDVRYASYLADFLDERFVIYSVDTNKYTADFARARMVDGETKIDFIGRVGASSTSGIIMILYVGATDESKSRADFDNIDFDNLFQKFDKVLPKSPR